MSKKDDERLYNFLICNAYATDEELEGMAPFMIVGIIVLVIFIVCFGGKSCTKDSNKDSATNNITSKVEKTLDKH